MAKRKSASLSRMILSEFRKDPNASLNYKQLSKRMGIADSGSRRAVLNALEKMVRNDQLVQEDRGKYKLKHKVRFLEGVIDFTQSGSAWVRIEGLSEDVKVSSNRVGRALQGDTVHVNISSTKKNKIKGEVIRVTERAEHHIIGRLEVFANYAFLIPDSNKYAQDFYVPLNKLAGGSDGAKVVGSFSRWDDDDDSPVAVIEEVIGVPGDRETEMLGVLAKQGFPLRFPDEVLKEAEALKSKQINEKGRRDLRSTLTFTIDPEDAKDFDDAISYKELENGNLEVGVHIADVSYYMEEGSALDKEAFKRATSVYLVDRVVPMLPEVLSNELCSLRPGEDKACYACVFELDDQGKVLDYWIGRTIIHSDRRYTYEEVQAILEGDDGDHKDALRPLNKIAKTLRKKRINAGAIAFNKTEIRFKLDEKKLPVGVYLKTQKDAHKLIEEFMLLANRTVAKHIGNPAKGNVRPFVYRVHDKPDYDKLTEFFGFIRKFGYEVRFKSMKDLPKAINELLDMIKGKPEEEVISMMAIRSMSKAFYTTENIGHFGLGFQFYSHFTSPIRRYPDVMAHRLLAKYASEKKNPALTELEAQCEWSSEQERKAADAERESTKFFQVLFLEDSVGKEFDAIVSGVTEWGLYAEISENKCEGMIRLTDLDGDYYYFDQKQFCIKGHNTGIEIHLGQKVIIRVRKVDLIKKFIDMELVAVEEPAD